MNSMLEGISKYFILYEIDGKIFQECDIPSFIGSKKGSKVVKVKPVSSEEKDECRERYLLCSCPADDFPYVLDEMQPVEDLLSYEWVPVTIERIFEYGDESTPAEESVCYMARIADDDLGAFECRLESFMDGNPSTEEMNAFVQQCSQSESDRLSVFYNLIDHNITVIREKNYWKWRLYRRADNPYNRR